MKLLRKKNIQKEKKCVVFLVANIKQYRTVFYERLSKIMALDNINIIVLYSEASKIELKKFDSVNLPEPLGFKIKRLYLLRDKILFQFVPLKFLMQADLIIVVQSNGYLINYLLQLLRIFGLNNLAFWGHGYNHQTRENSFLEKIKRLCAIKVDWWFAYTNNIANYLYRIGFPKEKITTINNTIDTASFSMQVDGISQADRRKLIESLGFPQNAIVGIFCGSLYEDKQLEFLLKASAILHKKYQNFRLIVIGNGPKRKLLTDHSYKVSWLTYVGEQYELNKAKYFAISDFFLNPGLVGLSILDSFAAGLPLITTDYKKHSPEIFYLKEGKNGMKLPFDHKLFANGVIHLVQNPRKLSLMKKEALMSSKKFTLENMVINVRDGILKYFEYSLKNQRR